MIWSFSMTIMRWSETGIRVDSIIWRLLIVSQLRKEIFQIKMIWCRMWSCLIRVMSRMISIIKDLQVGGMIGTFLNSQSWMPTRKRLYIGHLEVMHYWSLLLISTWIKPLIIIIPFIVVLPILDMTSFQKAGMLITKHHLHRKKLKSIQILIRWITIKVQLIRQLVVKKKRLKMILWMKMVVVDIKVLKQTERNMINH